MKKAIIIRWSEIHLKGKNRKHFESLLEDNIKRSLKNFNYKFVKRFYNFACPFFLNSAVANRNDTM